MNITKLNLKLQTNWLHNYPFLLVLYVYEHKLNLSLYSDLITLKSRNVFKINYQYIIVYAYFTSYILSC